MSKTRTVRFLVTEEQYDRLNSLASLKGYKTLSSYIRDSTLRRHTQQEEMIFKIYKKVVDDER